MKRHRTPARHVWVRALLLSALACVTAPTLAASPCPEIKFSPASLTITDFVLVNGNWIPSTASINAQPSTPKPNQGAVYQWTQVSGPAVTLSGANTPQPQFTAPDVAATGAAVVLRLTLAGCGGSATSNFRVNITDAHDIVVNAAPHAVASASPASANEGTVVTLDGSASSDPDGDALSYTWTQIGGPSVTIATPNQANASFFAPNVVATTSFSFRLTVSDGALANSNTAVVNVVWTNDPPVAALSCPLEANEGASVTLNASASSDSDDGIVSYAWTQGVALPVVPGVENWNTAIATFNAPSLGLHQTGLVPFELTITDASGAQSSAQCSIFIHDVTAPVISGTFDIEQEATSATGTSVAFATSAADAVDGDLSALLQCVPPSNSLFAIGTTAVSCQVSDSAGNAANAGFNVVIADHTAPVIAAHNAIAVEATGPDGAQVDYTPPATSDAVDGAGVATCAPPPGQFPLESTDVFCDASDSTGNAAVQTKFVVTVHDTTAPAFDPYDPVGPVEATGPSGAAVSYDSPTANDIVDGVVAVGCTPASGSTFPVDVTAVSCSALDAHGNSASTSFDVSVVDTTPPTIAAHDPVGPIEATGPSGAVVSYDVPAANDIVDGAVTVNCAPASGSIFAITTGTVTCSATDAHGNSANSSFDVTVIDSTPPTIAPHDPVGPIEATGPSGVAVSYDVPTANDIVDGPVGVNCTPANGSTFAIGATPVNCSATDAHGNTGTSTFDVSVVDTTPPELSGVSGDLIVEATSGAGAVVNYPQPSATDLVDGTVPVSCVAPSGSVFALGTHTVRCSTADAHGNGAAASFQITVRDTTAPSIAYLGNLALEATSAAGSVATFNPTANDAVDPTVTVSCTPNSGSTFALGTHTVSCSATDFSGNTATGSFTVSVHDTTAPTITAHENVTVTGASQSTATVHYTLPTAHDIVSGDVTVDCTPASDSTFAVGTTPVNCSAVDTAGNRATSSFQVTVHYTWTGFFRPIDNLPVVNTAKAGSAIPVRFSLGGNQGMAILAAGYPKSAQMACMGAVQDMVEETVIAGGSSLQYDAAANQYIYVWKTDKAWAGTCRQLQVKLADGTTQVANFNFTR